MAHEGRYQDEVRQSYATGEMDFAAVFGRELLQIFFATAPWKDGMRFEGS
jgi:hypothetical protein